MSDFHIINWPLFVSVLITIIALAVGVGYAVYAFLRTYERSKREPKSGGN